MFDIPFSYTTLGIILSIAGNLLISVSLNIQKSAHLDLATSSSRNSSNEQYYKNFKWQLGFILMSLGEIGNFVSYGLAPVSLVAPLGVVTIISNSTFVAPVLFHENIGAMNLVGTFLCAFGVTLMILCSMTTNQDVEPISDPFSYVDSIITTKGTLIYIIITTCLILFLIASLSLLKEKHKKRTIKFILSNLTIVAIVGSYTATSTKLLSSIVEFAPFDKIITNYRSYALLSVIILTSILQIKYLNKCLAIANATTVVPIHFVFFTSSVLICSIIVFRDFSKKTPLQMIIFLLGAFFTFSGVFFICGIKSDQFNGNTSATTANSSLLNSPNKLHRISSKGVIPIQQNKATTHISYNNNNNNNNKSIPLLSRTASSLISVEELLPCHSPTTDNTTSTPSHMGMLLQSSQSSPELVHNAPSIIVSPVSHTSNSKIKGHSHWVDPCSQLTPLISSGTSVDSSTSTLTYNATSSPLQPGDTINVDFQTPEVGSSYYDPRSKSYTPRKLIYTTIHNGNENGNCSEFDPSSTSGLVPPAGPKRRFSLGEFPHSNFDLESLRSGLFRNEGDKRSILGHGYFVLNNGGLINSIIGTNDELMGDSDDIKDDFTGSSIQSNQGKEQQNIRIEDNDRDHLEENLNSDYSFDETIETPQCPERMV